MQIIQPAQYNSFLIDNDPALVILDHLGGVDINYRSPVLNRLSNLTAGRDITVITEYIVNQQIKDNYPNFNFVFSVKDHNDVLDHFQNYKIHPSLTFENFLCSFNGSAHVSRKLLVSILNNFDLFDPEYSSKNFVFSKDTIDGHISDYVGDRNSFYNKFFLDNPTFYNTIYSFGHERFNHSKNIYTLERQLTGSFVHIVSETMATSYYPFYGEKFLYSIITRGLFVAYSQPLWHDMLERCYGFKKYTCLFNYNFDTIVNPVERLLELVTMLNKFSKLSSEAWRDLYELELETIEYNYNHYFSRDYLTCLEKFR